jgi:murein DD-endopeptidase MepM/ murein hydrolase activator NlpD
MNRQVCAIGIVVILVVAVAVLFILGQEPFDSPFDNEGRYDSTVLNSMGVIYSNQSDIAHWNEGYSGSDACPWGFAHNGLDYMFYNNSPVIAAAPGKVIAIEIGYLENSTVYKVGVHIQFNESVWLEYGFEGDANETVRAQQVAMLNVEVGDWVSKGDQIAKFMRPTEFDHVHFGVYLNDEAICPRLVMGVDDYNEIMLLVHSFHPTWELCYP